MASSLDDLSKRAVASSRYWQERTALLKEAMAANDGKIPANWFRRRR